MRFFKLAKNEIHVFWGYLSLQKMKFMFFEVFKLTTVLALAASSAGAFLCQQWRHEKNTPNVFHKVTHIHMKPLFLFYFVPAVLERNIRAEKNPRGGGTGVWHICFSKSKAEISVGIQELWHICFSKSKARKIRGDSKDLWDISFSESKKKKKIAGGSNGVPRVCDTFIFQSAEQKKRGVPRICDTFIFQSAKQKKSAGGPRVSLQSGNFLALWKARQ